MRSEKKTVIPLLALVATLLLTIPFARSEACSIPQDAMSTYADILKNGARFFCADGGDYYEPAEGRNTLLQEYLNSFDPPYQVEKFTVVDLDGDDIKDVVLEMQSGNFLQVLHFDGGIVYGYIFPYRAMIDLKQDGTFGFSSGAADSGTGKLKFMVGGYEYIEIENASEAEATVWHEFTVENINTCFR